MPDMHFGGRIPAPGAAKSFTRDYKTRERMCGFGRDERTPPCKHSRPVRICLLTRTPLCASERARMTWIKMSKRDRGRTGGRRERDEREPIKSVCTRARARMLREREREGIQYNCTHVYRVDGNILERILKYLLVV